MQHDYGDDGACRNLRCGVSFLDAATAECQGEPGPGRKWPKEFTPAVRELIAARDTPPGWGRPACTVCGQPVTGAVEVHHLLYKSRGGDGRPSNGAVVHGEGQAGGCHIQRIHDDGMVAAAAGWARSRHARDPYALPVRCAWRGLITLDDLGGWWPA